MMIGMAGSGSGRRAGHASEHVVVLSRAPGARAWLEAAGFSGEVRDDRTGIGARERTGEWAGEQSNEAPGTITIVTQTGPDADGARQVLEWRPQTFKQVLSRALALGAATGCQAGMMKAIADGEARLASLREKLGIDRKAPANDLAPCVVLVEGRPTSDLWVPDLIDRAAGWDANRRNAAAQNDTAQNNAKGHPVGEFPIDAHIVRFGPDILVPGPHLYDAVMRIARELYPNRT